MLSIDEDCVSCSLMRLVSSTGRKTPFPMKTIQSGKSPLNLHEIATDTREMRAKTDVSLKNICLLDESGETDTRAVKR